MTLLRPFATFFRLVAIGAVLLATELRSEEAAATRKLGPDLMRGEAAGQMRDDNALKMKLIWCPPGFVTMESAAETKTSTTPIAANFDDDERNSEVTIRTVNDQTTPVKVFLSRGFWLGKYEVTQAEWKQVLETEPWRGQANVIEGDNVPASCLTWKDATEFCRRLTERERRADRLADGWEYTLPTEAQWERACRARSETKYCFGDDESQLGDYAWFDKNAARASEMYAHPVGQKKANTWGFHDMHGNAWEWCRDGFVNELPGGRDPETTKEQRVRVIRGGGCCRDAPFCRSSIRLGYPTTYHCFDLGLRVALARVSRQPAANEIKK